MDKFPKILNACGSVNLLGILDTGDNDILAELSSFPMSGYLHILNSRKPWYSHFKFRGDHS